MDYLMQSGIEMEGNKIYNQMVTQEYYEKNHKILQKSTAEMEKNSKEAQRRDVSLTFLSVKSILPHVDDMKRLTLLLSYPRSRSLDYLVPLKIDKLILSPSAITINDIVFKFGTVYNFEKDGESEWRSLEHDVLEPGEVILEISLENLPDQWRDMHSRIALLGGTHLFSQLTVFKGSTIHTPHYVNRLPAELSIRHAFKKLTSTIFGNGRKIQVGSFRFDGCGIVPLPAGLKFDCERVNSLNLNEAKRVEAYNSVLEKVDQLSASLKWSSAKNSNLKNPMIQNCSKLEICPFRCEDIDDELTLLMNEVLYLGIEYTPMDITEVDFTVQIIDSWSKNESRKVGSKLVIAFHEPYRNNIFVTETFNSEEILQKGFKRVGRTRSLLPLKNGKTCVELTLSQDKHEIPSDIFLKKISFRSFLRIEIVNSK